MYSIQNISIESSAELFKYISEEDIYIHYLGDFDNNTWIKSPFRPNEKAPSFKISYYKSKWVWTDFGRDPRPKDPINLVQELYNLNFIDAINKIYSDVYLNCTSSKTIKSILPKTIYSSCKIFTEFKDFEFKYWEDALFTMKDLNELNIHSGEIRNNGIVWNNSTAIDPSFVYLFDKHSPIYKGYRPYSADPKNKFYAYNVVGHIQGYDLLPETGDILIITGSYKDVGVWKKLGYPAIAPHSENMFISPFDLYDLQKRFKHIYVNYNTDLTGITKSIQYTNEYDLKYFNIPSTYGCTDPFELIMLDPTSNYELLDDLFKKKFKRDNHSTIQQ